MTTLIAGYLKDGYNLMFFVCLLSIPSPQKRRSQCSLQTRTLYSQQYKNKKHTVCKLLDCRLSWSMTPVSHAGVTLK